MADCCRYEPKTTTRNKNRLCVDGLNRLVIQVSDSNELARSSTAYHNQIVWTGGTLQEHSKPSFILLTSFPLLAQGQKSHPALSPCKAAAALVGTTLIGRSAGFVFPDSIPRYKPSRFLPRNLAFWAARSEPQTGPVSRLQTLLTTVAASRMSMSSNSSLFMKIRNIRGVRREHIRSQSEAFVPRIHVMCDVRHLTPKPRSR